MDFSAAEGNITAGGFQLSLLSVPDDFRYIVDAAIGQGSGNQVDRIRKQILGNNRQEKKLVNHLVKLLAPQMREKEFQKSEQENSHLIVVEETKLNKNLGL